MLMVEGMARGSEVAAVLARAVVVKAQAQGTMAMALAARMAAEEERQVAADEEEAMMKAVAWTVACV